MNKIDLAIWIVGATATVFRDFHPRYRFLSVSISSVAYGWMLAIILRGL